MKRLSYDLAERTAAFGEQMIEFCLGISATAVSAPIINQLIRAATSIGAKYCEADDTESKRDFRHKIGICRKESREPKYWLRMIAQAVPAQKKLARGLWTEAEELHLIFAAIIRTTDRTLAATAASKAKWPAPRPQTLSTGY